MSVRILVNGASGKMGRVAIQAIQNDEELELVGEGRSKDDLIFLIESYYPDVVLDLTTAAVVFENTSTIIKSGVHPVIGTSGLLKEQFETLSQLCSKSNLGGVIVPNFSISAVLMMKFAKEAARYFSTVEIIELHHDEKRDSPSGTAIRTAEMISETLNYTSPKAEGETTIAGARGAIYQGIPIHSIRLPGLVAHQEVLFGSSGQTLKIKSDLINREAYGPGICLACKTVVELQELKYGLEHLL
jgi:4-hydroxy-tetrahydrodipicolinate reductase